MATKFQQKVWHAIESIPRGRVTTYGALAKHLSTGAVRAVGTAVGKNPNAPKVPCHRVVKADGTIGKYSAAGGTKKKIEILKMEGVKVEGGKVCEFEKVLFKF